MKIVYLISFLLLFVQFANAHPVHISITTIEYQAEKNGFVIAFKIFYDDMSVSVLNNYREKLNFEGSKKESEKSAQKYISGVFSISINEKVQDKRMKFAYSDINESAIWMYYVIPCKEKVNSIVITNNILNELYADQKNLVIVKIGDFEKGYSLGKNETVCKVQL